MQAVAIGSHPYTIYAGFPSWNAISFTGSTNNLPVGTETAFGCTGRPGPPVENFFPGT